HRAVVEVVLADVEGPQVGAVGRAEQGQKPFVQEGGAVDVQVAQGAEDGGGGQGLPAGRGEPAVVKPQVLQARPAAALAQRFEQVVLVGALADVQLAQPLQGR